MINTFQIWAHKLQILLPRRPTTTSFQTANTLFHVENRVTNLLDATQASPSTVTGLMVLGGSDELYQNIALPAAMFLPNFRNSEGAEEITQIQPYSRLLFTYNNQDPALTFDNVQTCYIGHNDYAGKYDVELIRPFIYSTPEILVPAGHVVAGVLIPGQIEASIFIDPFGDDPAGRKQWGMYVKAFVGKFTIGNVAVTIQDKASQYMLMNEPILMENFVYDFRNENNFQPKPFSPWIAVQRHEYRVVFYNLTTEDTKAQLGFFGNLCKFSVTP